MWTKLKQHKGWLWIILGIILLFSGWLSMLILGFFNPVGGQGVKPNYDPKQVREVNPKSAVQSLPYLGKIRAAGQVAMPEINLSTPIYEGINWYQMLYGAGEQMPRSVVSMGQKGNYILASHHADSDHLLFAPLGRARQGMSIWTTNGDRIYQYKVDWVQTVSTSSDALNQPKRVTKVTTKRITTVDEKTHKKTTQTVRNTVDQTPKWITMYTCPDPYIEQPYRIVVRGHFVKSYTIRNHGKQLDPRLKVFYQNGTPSAYLNWRFGLNANDLNTWLNQHHLKPNQLPAIKAHLVKSAWQKIAALGQQLFVLVKQLCDTIFK